MKRKTMPCQNDQSSLKQFKYILGEFLPWVALYIMTTTVATKRCIKIQLFSTHTFGTFLLESSQDWGCCWVGFSFFYFQFSNLYHQPSQLFCFLCLMIGCYPVFQYFFFCCTIHNNCTGVFMTLLTAEYVKMQAEKPGEGLQLSGTTSILHAEGPKV